MMTSELPPVRLIRPIIVVGVDGSPTSIRAGAYAAGMARRLEGTLVCVFVHVVGGLAATVPEAAAGIRATQNEIVNDIKKLVADAVAADSLAGLPALRWTFVERTGNPFHELVAEAAKHAADAVVVGASTQAGHRLIGSLAVHLVKMARWPVTVVP